MSPLQNLYLTLFNFGPAIILGIYKQWWVGFIALFVGLVLSWLLALFTLQLQGNALIFAAWLKPPIVAAVVLGGGWWLF